jgi:hypothetical protein
MKIGSVLRLSTTNLDAAERHGWLWVYESKMDYAYAFRAVADGYLGTTAAPWLTFENWEAEDETDAG